MPTERSKLLSGFEEQLPTAWTSPSSCPWSCSVFMNQQCIGFLLPAANFHHKILTQAFQGTEKLCACYNCTFKNIRVPKLQLARVCLCEIRVTVTFYLRQKYQSNSTVIFQSKETVICKDNKISDPRQRRQKRRINEDGGEPMTENAMQKSSSPDMGCSAGLSEMVRNALVCHCTNPSWSAPFCLLWYWWKSPNSFPKRHTLGANVFLFQMCLHFIWLQMAWLRALHEKEF